MTARYQCRKCQAELDPKQKVCPRCGERTPAGGKFDVEEEQHWRPSPKAIKITAAVVVAIVLALVLYHSLHVVPPDIVAKQWFEAMVSRSLGTGGKLITPAFKDKLAAKMSNLTALADEMYTYVYTNSGTYRVGQPVYHGQSRAEVTVFLTYPDNTPGPQIRIQMVKVGRRWMVDDVII
jgi:hypothetical protein